MLSPEQISSLREGNFELSFLRLTLRQNTSVAPQLYEGPGEVRQAAGGDLLLRIFDTTTGVTFPARWVAGEVVSAGEYFTLEGTAVDGSVWTAEYLLPDAQWASGGVGCVVVARVRELRSISAAIAPQATTHLRLVLAEALQLPPTDYSRTRVESGGRGDEQASLDTAVFDAAGLAFHCRVLTDQTLVDVRSGTPIAPSTELRVIEAFQFLLGQELHPVYVRLTGGTQECESIRSQRLRSSGTERPTIEPALPLDFRHSADAWRLFDCYLKFVIPHTTQDEAHPVSAEWQTLILSSASGLEGQALQSAVSAEAILKLTDVAGAKLKPTLTGDDTRVADWVDRFDTFLTTTGCPEEIRSRLLGFFRPLFEMSSTNRMRRLANVGAIEQETIKSWITLRNTRAHGVRGKLRAVEEVIAARDAVFELLYQLVFYAISYQGPFIAYGSRGWPVKNYPSDLTGAVTAAGTPPVGGALP